MKRKHRLCYTILSVCMLLTLCCCGTKQTPSIKSSEFSKETQSILQPLEKDTKFFDFTVDSSITHAAVTVRYCENGTWQEAKTIAEMSDMKPGDYQMILRWIDDRIDVMISQEGVSFSNQYFIEQEHWDAFNETKLISTVGFANEQPIAAGEEIPLWCTYGSNSEEISAQSLHYNDSDCDTGFVIAVAFT